jgi:5-methylcytosine-specific restriction endonuclease McrA
MTPTLHGPNWARNRRKREQRRGRGLLPVALKRAAGRCHWCRRELVLLPALEARCAAGRARLLRRGADWVEWEEAGLVWRAAYATADHLTPLALGGTSAPDNVVASCPGCNRDREGSLPAVVCRCGRKRQKGREECAACLAMRRRASRLEAMGWDYWPDGAGGRWQDPVTGRQHEADWALWLERKWGGGFVGVSGGSRGPHAGAAARRLGAVGMRETGP